MTSMLSDKCYVISAMAMRAAASLCMVAMVVGCSSVRDSSSRPAAPGAGVAGQVQASNGGLANKSENIKDGCLTLEQKKEKLQASSDRESSIWQSLKDSIVRSVFGETGDSVYQASRVADKDGALQTFTRDAQAKDCGPEHTIPAATAGTADGTSAVR